MTSNNAVDAARVELLLSELRFAAPFSSRLSRYSMRRGIS
jgi:hypothetical protein